MTKSTVSVKWTPEPVDQPVLDMANIRIEVDEDQPERVWIWMIRDGEKVEGGSFDLKDFMSAVLDYYNTNY
jgi:hypothetical protein